MAKVVKFLSPFQLARLLKSWTPDMPWSVLENLIDEGDPFAIFIDIELGKFGYGSWEDEEFGCGFTTPPTRILTKILSKIMSGNKVFIPIDEELVHLIPQPPKKWRWRQVDKCHRRWGWVAA